MADAGNPQVAKDKKPKEKKPKAAAAQDGAAKGPVEMNPPPEFINRRLEIFDRIRQRQVEELAQKPREEIKVTMPDGSVKLGVAWETTPGEIARGISNSLYKKSIVARLDGDREQLWDLERPLERSCNLELLNFDDDQGKMVFWHSSAHVLGEASEKRFGCQLCIGPPIDNGFYYEMALPDGKPVMSTDWEPLESIFNSAVKEKQTFERLTMTKEELLDMFEYNTFKQRIINSKIPDGTSTTVYRNGPFIDLCRGPHVPDTSRITSFAITKNSASYFLGDANNESLQRIYGISFPDKKQMAAYKKFLEEAAKRDHRKIGKDQELFFFSDMSPGSAMWLPHGARIYNTLLAYIKEQYWKRDYEEVITPNMYNSELWKTSGHWNYYKDDMFVINSEDETKFALKPMNCPGHCLLFGHRERSHRELPWRVADFGVLHRNEASGALSGLTRVRRFQQDDAHIFCKEDQIKGEMADLFDFLSEMYGLLGMTFKLKLSTRPEKFMGEIATWDRAEAALRESLDEFSAQTKSEWSLNPGDGAFYGPKIDITIVDCLGRDWQCATIQLDFVQPVNFGLEYMTGDVPAVMTGGDADAAAKGAKAPDAETKDGAVAAAKPKALTPGCARPVMIHRAMAGSIERFTAILCEHYAGKWPFWLNPRQILIVPVDPRYYPYAEKVHRRLKREGRFFADVDLGGNTMAKKIRNGQLAQYNYIFVVGESEQTTDQVNVRCRDDVGTQQRDVPIPIDVVLAKLKQLRDERGSHNPLNSAGDAPEAADKSAEKAT